MKKVSLCFCFSFLVFASVLSAAEYFVSPQGDDAGSGAKEQPFRTVLRARDQIRADQRAGKAGPWVVTLSEGEFPLEQPLEFTTEDSGTEAAPVVYRGQGEKTVLTGGLDITGWKEESEGVWSANLPELDGQPLFFEQFFVNGRRAARSRYPDRGFLKPAGVSEENPMDPKTRRSEVTMQYLVGQPGDLDLLKAIPKEEYRWAQMVLHHNWDTTRRILLDFDAEKNQMTFRGGNMKSWNPWRTSSQYYLENVRTAFNEPGEWFYDGNAKKVLYRPLPGETLAGSRFIVPRPGLNQLILVRGASKEAPVTNLRFENLSFAYSDAARRADMLRAAGIDPAITGDVDKPGPSQYEPMQAAAFTVAVIMVDEARKIVFDGCRFNHLGEYGLWFRNTSECQFVNGDLMDLGAGGVRLGGGRANEKTGIVTCCEKNVIRNCRITNGGRFFAAAVGVWIGNNTMGNEVTHNDIGDFFYTGVSMGWNWGYHGVCFDNHVDFNRIYDIGQGALADMGGVYTLGTLKGSTVCNNVIYNVKSFGYGGWGLYTDEGSEGLRMENNLVYDTTDGSFHQHYGRDNIIRNNILVRSYLNPQRKPEEQPHQLAATRVEEHRSFLFEKNIIYWDRGTAIGYRFDKVKSDIRNNLWWCTTGPVEFQGKTHEQWEAEGKDIGGKVADPLFVDAANNDFRLKPESPAFGMGFRAFDFSQAGAKR
ncbi:MAG: right-handed parallel beta-helix repeat-containing protein [Planctomycetia bacterium]|nr:right-handed parallel beta-helix repeat-containing protein [Planctomycetia bacterium]